MEITLNKKTNTEGVIKIKLTEGDYQPHVEEKVRDYSRKANIKGFRQGKVPAGVIKKMFGKSILVDEINTVLSTNLKNYIKDNNLKILGDPLPNHEKSQHIDWDSQKDFEFEYHIGMVDNFTYDLSSSVKVKSYSIEIDKKTLDDTLSNLKKRFAKPVPAEQSDADSQLVGELRAVHSDINVENASLAVADIDPQAQQKFIGVKAGDEIQFAIDTLFSDEAAKARLLKISAEEAKDATGDYVFTVRSITKSEPAEINQEFFNLVFGEGAVQTEEEFMTKIKETIGQNYKRETDHFLDHNIEDYFLSNTAITLPDEFLKNWLQASGQEGASELLDKDFENYKRELKWDLIKTRMAEDLKIAVEAEEVKNKAKDMIASQFGGYAAVSALADRLDGFADNYLQSNNGQNFMRLYGQLKTEKVLNHIKETITVQEQKVTLDEFEKIVKEHTH